eukprot:TRINITY_DN174_c0_g1_i1.p1 TRINITY_DN174_c0_g1~~TRINITY_DN174_c0_g1_i1.p1  ORF type:complete len:224 (+),score=66.15 TRINITY_DN174_c0_g1_i1:24-695(+)
MSSSDSSKDHDYLLKIVVIGESGVGKTNLIERYTKDTFYEESKSTIGVEFGHKTIEIDGSVVKTQIWDTAGQERFRALTRPYYRGAVGAVLVFSLADRESFDKLGSWFMELEMHADQGIHVMLIGNKSDLEDSRQVPTDLAINFAKEHGIDYMETSAKDKTNVEKAFQLAIAEIYHSIVDEEKIEQESSSDSIGMGSGATITLEKPTDTKPASSKSGGCPCGN